MAEIRLDTFIDPALVRKVSGIVRDMLKEKGFQSAEVTPEIVTMPGGPKLVHLTFHMSEGPKVKIKKIEFTGNKVFSTSTAEEEDEGEPGKSGCSRSSTAGACSRRPSSTRTPTRSPSSTARTATSAPTSACPSRSSSATPKDKKTRWIELRIPVTEGRRYKVGDVEFTGNTIVKTEYLKPLFKLNAGDYYNEKNVRKGMEKAREVYGGGGYWEFTGFPDYKFHDDPNPAEAQAPQALAAPLEPGPAIVDVTMRLQEGQQYFVNRITFVGNSTTHDTVIRRQMRLAEDGVFNTEALKSSIKLAEPARVLQAARRRQGRRRPEDAERDEQGGRPGEARRAEPQPADLRRRRVAVRGLLRAAVVPDVELPGPRREPHACRCRPARSRRTTRIGFTEPFLFDRNMTGGVQLFKQEIHYINQFTQTTDRHAR